MHYKSILFILFFIIQQACYAGSFELINTTENEYFFALYNAQGFKQGKTFKIDSFVSQDISYQPSDILYINRVKDVFPQKVTNKFAENTEHLAINDEDIKIFIRDVNDKGELVSSKDAHIESHSTKLSTDKSENTGDKIVRLSYDLCDEEKDFLKKRKKHVMSAFQKIGIDIKEGDNIPNIGILSSGGGMRALIGSFGVVAALKHIGIWDMTTYAAGVSGSTWMLSALYGKNDTFESLRNDLQNRLQGSFLSSLYDFLFRSKKEQLAYKSQREELYNLVDQWGLLLGKKIFGTNEHPIGAHITLSSLRECVDNGEMPLYLSTAVTVDQRQKGGGYHWFEFTPYEVGSKDYGAFVPAEYFGAKFHNGNLVEKDFKEYPIASCCGIFGSAFAVTVHRTLKSMNLSSWTKNTFIKDSHPVSSGVVYNFMRGMEAVGFGNLLTRQKTIDLFDAAVHYNLPLRPLLHRKLDLMIVINIFGGKNQGALLKALQDGKKQGYAMPGIDDVEHLDDNKLTVIEDLKNPTAPLIIYVPNVSHLYPTGKLTYSQQDFNILYRDMYNLIIQNQDVIHEVCRHVYKKINNHSHMPLVGVNRVKKNQLQNLSSGSLHIPANQKMILFLNTLFRVLDGKIALNIEEVEDRRSPEFKARLAILYASAKSLMEENAVCFKLINKKYDEFLKNTTSKTNHMRIIELLQKLRNLIYLEADQSEAVELLNIVLSELKAPLFSSKAEKVDPFDDPVKNFYFHHLCQIQRLSLGNKHHKHLDVTLPGYTETMLWKKISDYLQKLMLYMKNLKSEGYQDFIDEALMKRLQLDFMIAKNDASEQTHNAFLDLYRAFYGHHKKSEALRFLVEKMNKRVFSQVREEMYRSDVPKRVLDEAYDTFKYTNPVSEARSQTLFFLEMMSNQGKEKRE
jgi:hypothetical protein